MGIYRCRGGRKGIIADGAVYFSGGKVVEVGKFAALKKKYPTVMVKGNEKQLLMPGLIDGHSHGWGLTCVQRGLTYDYLENALIDWASLINIDPEINAMPCAVRHLRGGCTTIHHNNFGEAPQMGEIARKAIKGYQNVGIRFAYSPGVRNVNILALNDTDFLETLPPDLKKICQPMVYFDKQVVIDEFFDIFESLYKSYNGEDSRIYLAEVGPGVY